MIKLSERIARLEQRLATTRPTRRIVQHVLDCNPADRPARLAAIEAEEPDAFHIVRIVVRPGEPIAA